MKFLRDYFKSKRRDAIAREFMALLWQRDMPLLKTCDAAERRRLSKVLGAVAYSIADVMEAARNR